MQQDDPRNCLWPVPPSQRLGLSFGTNVDEEGTPSVSATEALRSPHRLLQ